MEDDAKLPCAEKLAFSSQRAAQDAATVAEYQHGNALNPYICHHCGLWHLSSA